MKTYDIIVLDTGIDLRHIALSKYDNIDSMYFTKNGEDIVLDNTDLTGHGTAVTWLIKNKLPSAHVLSLRIFDIIQDEVICTEERLIKALEYIELNYKVKVINLSSCISQVRNMSELKKITRRLANKGVVIVSPHHNNHSLSYPASFEWVIGVAIDTKMVRGTKKVITNDGVVNIFDSLRQYQIPQKNNYFELKTGVSFSCSEVSVDAYLQIQKGAKNVFDVIENLKKVYTYQPSRLSIPKSPQFVIKKAAIFPFNKEIRSMVRFSYDLPFEIVDIYDLKYSLNVGYTTKSILQDDSVPEFTIKNIDNIVWNSFDTLILGCTKELSLIYKNYLILKNLIVSAIEHNKNIYSFENISDFFDIKELNKNKLFYPEVNEDQLLPNRGGRFAKTAATVVGVYGTSSMQGKFTLQLELRREAKKMGCNLGHIATEPSTLLFGIDYVFPMGYNGTIYIREEEKILYCNDLIRKLSESNCELILVGSQRETIPKQFENIYNLCTNTYAFLQGTKPDYAVLMISINDDYDYIKRTINFLYALTKTETIALVVSPFGTKQNVKVKNDKNYDEINKELIKKMKSVFEIPIFTLGESGLARKLLEMIAKKRKA